MLNILESLEPRQLFSSNHFTETDLVSNQVGGAQHRDTDLVNGWGIDIRSNGTLWVSAADTGKSTIYDDQGNTILTSVVVDGSPTGLLYNHTSNFVISNGGNSHAADVLFVTEQGKIEGWDFSVDTLNTVTMVDQSAKGSSFKGFALNQIEGSGARLFAADFGKGKVSVFNGSFKAVKVVGGFKDPNLPAGYSPFNVSLIGKNLFVAYAKKQIGTIDEVDGAGLGIVDEYAQDGTFIKRFATGGKLNAPWAIVKAPKKFGAFGGDILIGNFGDGKINAFDPKTGAKVGALKDSDGHTVVIDGLWGMTFGVAGTSDAKKLFFAAGPDGESNGLVGFLTADPVASSGGGGLGY